MNDGDPVQAAPQCPERSKTVYDSSAAQERGIRSIAQAQMMRHRRLSKLSVKERRRALAQWLRGMQP